jgi:signal transduction histidine kinase
VFATEYRVRDLKGRSILVHGTVTALPGASGRVTGYVGVINDITATRALRAQVALAARLSAIGPLVVDVKSAIDESNAEQHPNLPRALERARESSERIARIIKEMKQSAESTPGRIRVRLYDIVNQALHWLPPSIIEASSIKVEKQGAPEIRASAGQIEQVIVNLVSNAARAVPGAKRGAVVVRLGAGAPGMVRVEILDRGAGIEPSTLQNFIAPPFVASDRDVGAGLGLAVSQAIVASHGGRLTVESSGGKGTSFRMDLPDAGARA